MKSFFIYLSLALLFLIIKSTLLHHLLSPILVPDVILIMAFYFGFSRASIEGAVTIFVFGYLSDMFSGGIIGLSSFALIFVFIIATWLSKIVTLNSMLVKIGGTAFMSLLKGILIYMFLRFLNQKIPFYITFTTAASTAILSPFIFAIFGKIDSYFALNKGAKGL